jgi:hypothetical protein
VQGLADWKRSNKPDDIVFIDVLTETDWGNATPNDAAQWEDYNDINFPVLADEDGSWKQLWGANGGQSQHSYTVIDSEGQVYWRLANGSGGSVNTIVSQAQSAP